MGRESADPEVDGTYLQSTLFTGIRARRGTIPQVLLDGKRPKVQVKIFTFYRVDSNDQKN